MGVIVRNVVICDPRGLHTRPSAAIAAVARSSQATITLSYMGRRADAGSVLGLMMLAATRGAQIEVTGEGEGCHEAVEEVCHILRSVQTGPHPCR